MMPAKAKRPSVVLRARVPAETAKRIRQIARREKKTESEVVREGLELIARRERRRAGIEKLISLIPEKIPTKDQYAARFGKW